MLDSMTCSRCNKVADAIVAHPAIGQVCCGCWTDADQRIAYPGSLERRARFDAACEAVKKRHPESGCEALKDEQRIACPIHDNDSSEEE